jgi:hypothetical protein
LFIQLSESFAIAIEFSVDINGELPVTIFPAKHHKPTATLRHLRGETNGMFWYSVTVTASHPMSKAIAVFAARLLRFLQLSL